MVLRFQSLEKLQKIEKEDENIRDLFMGHSFTSN